MKTNNNNTNTNTDGNAARVTAETLQTLHELRVKLAADLADIRNANDHRAPVFLAGYANDGDRAALAVCAAALSLEVLQGYAYGEDLRHLAQLAAVAASRLLEFANSVEE